MDDLYKGRKLPDEDEVPEDARTVFAYLKAATEGDKRRILQGQRGRIIC